MTRKSILEDVKVIIESVNHIQPKILIEKHNMRRGTVNKLRRIASSMNDDELLALSKNTIIEISNILSEEKLLHKRYLNHFLDSERFLINKICKDFNYAELVERGIPISQIGRIRKHQTSENYSVRTLYDIERKLLTKKPSKI